MILFVFSRVHHRFRTGQAVDLENTLQEIVDRDRRDEDREIAPLRRADDAVLVDTSDLTMTAVLEHMVALARQRLAL